MGAGPSALRARPRPAGARGQTAVVGRRQAELHLPLSGGALAACFFFQAEDGIRGSHVTGVQTCALPIWMLEGAVIRTPGTHHEAGHDPIIASTRQIGRASCREKCRDWWAPLHQKKK